jgi:opacity protein-like surface antigen
MVRSHNTKLNGRSGDKTNRMTCGGGAGFTPLYIAVLLLFFSPCIGGALAAQEPVGSRVSFQPGVLELSGTTALSVQYQNENGGIREYTQLRVTPSIGYFLMQGLEVMLNASYIHNILRNEDPNFPVYDDRSHSFLFTMGPAYSIYQLSDIFVPYAGILLGTYYQKISTQMPGREDSRSDLQFALGLATGMRWMLTENLALKTGLQYVHGFAGDHVGSTNYLGIEIGISVFIPTWPSSSFAPNQ